MKRFINIFASLALLFALATASVPVHADNPNLMANPSAETANPAGTGPANWTENSWGTNTTTSAYQSTAHSGSKSLSVTMSGRTDGDAKWIPDASAVTAGQSYTYTDYYESAAATELDAQYTDASGNVTYAYLGSVAPSASWQQSSAVFTVPANEVSISVLHILAANGTLQTDDFSLSQTVSVAPPAGELIANPSFETANGGNPANWNAGSWGTNNAQFTYGSTAHSGSKSATVSMTSYTSGDAKWYANPVSITPGTTYTYSDYYQSNVVTSVMAAFTMSDGSTSYVSLIGAPANTGWAQYSANFTAPTGATSVTIYHLLSSVGSLTIDDVNLSVAPTPPPTQNLAPNSSVETVDPSNAKLPFGWQSNAWGTNTTTFSYLASGAHTGTHAVQVNMTKYTDGDAKWFFNPVAVTPDIQYTFSDYYKASVATEVDVAFTMSDGSTVYQIIGLPDPATSWTKFATTFTVPQGAETMTVYHLIHNVGSLTVDDDNLQTYKPVGFQQPLVTITMDDGYNNMYTQALPLLQKYGFTSTQFIITDVLNTNGYLTNAQVQTLYKDGNEIASHTVTHNNMLTETATQQKTELSQSQTTLQKIIGVPVTDMAFPNGLYNKSITAETKTYYTGARGVEDGLNSKDNFNPYNIKVQNVYNTTTATQVADWVKQAQATNTWLVLVYHSVDPNLTNPVDQGIYNVTPTQFDAELAAIKSSGVKVVTMQQAIKTLSAQL